MSKRRQEEARGSSTRNHKDQRNRSWVQGSEISCLLFVVQAAEDNAHMSEATSCDPRGERTSSVEWCSRAESHVSGGWVVVGPNKEDTSA